MNEHKITLNDKGEAVVGEGVPFERIARITGYLSSVTTWNDAKQAELKDRSKHDIKNPSLKSVG